MTLPMEEWITTDGAALCREAELNPSALDVILPELLDAFARVSARDEGAEQLFLQFLVSATWSEESLSVKTARALKTACSPAAAVYYIKRISDRRGEWAPALLDALIDALRHDGRTAEALDAARHLRQMLPDNAAVQIIEAEAMRHHGDHEGAERLLREVLPQAADNPWVSFWLAEYAAQRGDWREAYTFLRPIIPAFGHAPAVELFCRAALDINPDETLTHLKRAADLGVSQNKLDEFRQRALDTLGANVLTLLDALVDNAPIDSESAVPLAETLAATLKPLLYLGKMLFGNLDVRHKKALARVFAVSRQNGTAELQSSISYALFASAAGDAVGVVSVADWLRQSGLSNDARTYLLQALAEGATPGHLIGWQCVEVLRHDGLLLEADQIVGELISAHRNDIEGLGRLAEQARSADSPVDEERFCVAALAVRPDSPTIRLHLAEIAAAAGKDDRVVDLLSGFVPLSEHPRALLLLARASFVGGQYGEAVALTEKVIAAWPGDEETREFHLRALAVRDAYAALLDPEAASHLDPAVVVEHGRVLLGRGMAEMVAAALAPLVETAGLDLLSTLADAALATNNGALARRALVRLMAAPQTSEQPLVARTLERAGDFAIRQMQFADAAVWYCRAATMVPSAHIEMKLRDLDRRRGDLRPAAISDKIAPISIATGDTFSGRVVGLAEAAREYADAHFQIPFEHISLDFEHERFDRLDQRHMEPLGLHLGIFQNVLCGEIYTPILPEHQRVIFNATYSNVASAGTPIRIFGRNFEYAIEKPVQVFDEPVVIIGGSVECNYYHWLINWLPRFMIAEQVEQIWPKLKQYKYVVHPNVLSVPQFRESIDRIGISYDRLLLCDSGKNAILFRRCAIPSFLVQQFYHPQVLDFLRKRVGRIDGTSPPNTVPGQRIFISRQCVKAPKRRIHNFDEIRPILEKYDFRIVETENMSLADQVEMTNSASIICAMSGAALANLVFSNSDSRLLLLSPDFLYDKGTYRYWSGLSRLIGFSIEFFIIRQFFDGERELNSCDRVFHYIDDMNLDVIIEPRMLDEWLARQINSAK